MLGRCWIPYLGSADLEGRRLLFSPILGTLPQTLPQPAGLGCEHIDPVLENTKSHFHPHFHPTERRPGVQGQTGEWRPGQGGAQGRENGP